MIDRENEEKERKKREKKRKKKEAQKKKQKERDDEKDDEEEDDIDEPDKLDQIEHDELAMETEPKPCRVSLESAQPQLPSELNISQAVPGNTLFLLVKRADVSDELIWRSSLISAAETIDRHKPWSRAHRH